MSSIHDLEQIIHNQVVKFEEYDIPDYDEITPEEFRNEVHIAIEYIHDYFPHVFQMGTYIFELHIIHNNDPHDAKIILEDLVLFELETVDTIEDIINIPNTGFYVCSNYI